MKLTPLALVLYESGHTQKAIARAAGLNPHTVAAIVAGHRQPRMRTVYALSKALGKPIDTLLASKGGAS